MWVPLGLGIVDKSSDFWHTYLGWLGGLIVKSKLPPLSDVIRINSSANPLFARMWLAVTVRRGGGCVYFYRDQVDMCPACDSTRVKQLQVGWSRPDLWHLSAEPLTDSVTVSLRYPHCGGAQMWKLEISAKTIRIKTQKTAVVFYLCYAFSLVMTLTYNEKVFYRGKWWHYSWSSMHFTSAIFFNQ